MSRPEVWWGIDPGTEQTHHTDSGLALAADPRQVELQYSDAQPEVKMSAPPFNVRDLGEVAIRCRDLAAMTAFYSDIVGLDVIEGDYADNIVFLRIAEGFAGHTQVVALFTTDDEEMEEEELEVGGNSSLHHLALTVKAEDLAPALAWYRTHGLEPWTAEHRWVGWDSVYVKDPEGNTVELVASVRQRSASVDLPVED